MWTPELIVSIAGFALTFGTMLYKFGRLEGTIMAEISALKDRIGKIEQFFFSVNGRV